MATADGYELIDLDDGPEPPYEPNMQAMRALDWLSETDAVNALHALEDAGFSLLRFGEIPHWMVMWQCEAAELNRPAVYRLRPDEEPF